MKISILFAAILIGGATVAQTIGHVEMQPSYGVMNAIASQAGKGIWLASGAGMTLYNPATGKFQAYNQTDDGKTLPAIQHIAVNKDKIACAGQNKIYLLQATGKWKEITSPEIKSAAINGMTFSSDELTVIDKTSIHRYRAGKWIPLLNYVSNYARIPEKSFVFADGARYYYNFSDGMYYYDTTLKKSTRLSYTAINEAVVIPGQGCWLREGYTIYYIPVGYNKFSLTIAYRDQDLFGSTPSNNPFASTRNKTIGNARLVVNEKNEPILVSADTVVKLLVSPSLMSDFKITAEKTTIQKTGITSSARIGIYNNVAYRSSEEGFMKLAGTKPELLKGPLLKADNKEGYMYLMPDNKIYTKDRNAIWVSDGKNPVKKIELNGWVLDLASDGKRTYILTETRIYREGTGGSFDSIGKNENTMKVISVDKKGVLWMASHTGIGSWQNGKTEFTTAREISNFPQNQAVHSIHFGPDGTCYIAYSNVYTYKDKQMKLIPQSPALIYNYYFDNTGGVYYAGLGDYYYQKGSTITNLEAILTEKYPDLRYPKVHGLASDGKGRIWALVAFTDKKGLVVLEDGKVKDFFSEQFNIPDPFATKLFYRNNELLITDTKGGITLAKIMN